MVKHRVMASTSTARVNIEDILTLVIGLPAYIDRVIDACERGRGRYDDVKKGRRKREQGKLTVSKTDYVKLVGEYIEWLKKNRERYCALSECFLEIVKTPGDPRGVDLLVVAELYEQLNMSFDIAVHEQNLAGMEKHFAKQHIVEESSTAHAVDSAKATEKAG